MQRLYENHKVLTYPRTDSRYIGADIVPTIKERLKPAESDRIKHTCQDIKCADPYKEVLWMIKRSVTTMLSFRRSSLSSWTT